MQFWVHQREGLACLFFSILWLWALEREGLAAYEPVSGRITITVGADQVVYFSRGDAFMQGSFSWSWFSDSSPHIQTGVCMQLQIARSGVRRES